MFPYRGFDVRHAVFSIMLLPALSSLILFGLSGCQCCRLYNPYADVIDDVSDHEGNAQVFWSPRWDLTRIGKADWCGTKCVVCGGCKERCQEEGSYTPPCRCHPYPQAYPYVYPNDALQRTQWQEVPPAGGVTPMPVPPSPAQLVNPAQPAIPPVPGVSPPAALQPYDQ